MRATQHESLNQSLNLMARLAGIEPATLGFGGIGLVFSELLTSILNFLFSLIFNALGYLALKRVLLSVDLLP